MKLCIKLIKYLVLFNNWINFLLYYINLLQNNIILVIAIIINIIIKV